MFDVSWTDETRETVGQRKNRKDQQASRSSRGSSVRSSNSSESQSRSHSQSLSQSQSQSQNRPSILNLFGNNSHNNKKGLKRTESHSKLPTPKPDEKDKSSKGSRRISSFNISDIGHEFLPTSRVHSSTFFPEEPSYQSDHEHSSASDGDSEHLLPPQPPPFLMRIVPESVFSGWTDRSGNTESSTWSSVVESSSANVNPGKFVNSMSASSFVTQSTEIKVSPRESIKADEQIATLVSISAAPTMPVEIRDTQTKGSNSSSIYAFPMPNTYTAQRPESVILPPSPILGRTVVDSNPQTSWPIPSRRRPSDSWRPPDEWECLNEVQDPLSLQILTRPLPPLLPQRNSRRKQAPPELTHPQRNIRRMDAASSKIVLERLKEEWNEVADASVYRELELEKQLWMLTALQHLKKKSSMDLTLAGQVDGVSVERDLASTKLLSLYENHASASLLSALHPTPRIHHISTSPLSPTSYPNIQPLAVHSPTAHLPYASNLFTAIHAFSLPAILPASSIPTILREIHRTLRSSLAPINTLPGLLQPPSPTPTSPTTSFSSISTSNRTIIPFTPKPAHPSAPISLLPPSKSGTIHLTLLNPSPLPTTLGPKLRHWLSTHLLLNLERQFRCQNPTQLFPLWLADAGLRGEGSTIVTVQFQACIGPCSLSLVKRKEGEEEEDRKKELKSVVGRMLWREIWGGFVEGERWWWEDEEIVDECVGLGTRWEYAVIEGVRER